MGGRSSKPRWYVSVFLEEMHTMTSGEMFGSEGEWYFKVNSYRYPQKGVILLSKNETFNPEPKPSIYTVMVTQSPKKPNLVLDIRIMEEDLIWDDTMLKEKLTIPFQEGNKSYDLKSKDGKVTLKLKVYCQNRQRW